MSVSYEKYGRLERSVSYKTRLKIDQVISWRLLIFFCHSISTCDADRTLPNIAIEHTESNKTKENYSFRPRLPSNMTSLE